MSKQLFKHYRPLYEQLRIHRQSHSGTWKIISNALGKKQHAQEELDKIKSALKLRELLEERMMLLNDLAVGVQDLDFTLKTDKAKACDEMHEIQLLLEKSHE